MIKQLLFLIPVAIGACACSSQAISNETYCNPLNLDYTYMIYNAARGISYRSGADPAVVRFRDKYYMFVTRSLGYWQSDDLVSWTFIKPGTNWYPQGCNAPAAHNYRDSLLFVCGDPSGSMSVLYSDNPSSGNWEATPAILNNLQDPDLFIDDNGDAYMYWGSSNKYPIRGVRLNRKHMFIQEGEKTELFNLNPELHGWERFGENHTDTLQSGYIEGPWMTKYNDKYYLQYAAPGTQFNVYADGVYVSDNPLGPFSYQEHNPVSYKGGGYMNGAGHGSTVQTADGQYWHFASMSFPVNMIWERRLCMFPSFFDKDGIMYCDTRFGDYPHYTPSHTHEHSSFRGWMLLSYRKNVTASSKMEGFPCSGITDENSSTYWVAQSNNDNQWVCIDLDDVSTVRAIQINYNDFQSDMYGRYPNLRHRYEILSSADGRRWKRVIDKRNNRKDVPNDYVELPSPVEARYIKFRNVEVPTPNLSVSAIRVFGNGHGEKPAVVSRVSADRRKDSREVSLSWIPSDGAQGYNVLWGIAPDKLYSSWMVYGNDCKHINRSLTKGQTYYFAVEAFNENGVSGVSPVIKVE